MSLLADSLRKRILSSGPITFHDWMAAALYDPEHGYYSKPENRWGRAGDYRTSPERTHLFAATFARYFACLYNELGAPKEFAIIESGAGAGHFASGVLKALRDRFPELYKVTRYLIDERSDESRSVAATRLEEFSDRVQFITVTDVPEVANGIVFANELLDAFPVHRIAVRDGKLQEFYVGLDSNNDFAWLLGEPSTNALESYFADAGVYPEEGRVSEVNLEISGWLNLVSSKLKRGFLILVDYGADASDLFRSTEYQHGSLRAFSKHQIVEDLLESPGRQDLTTTIDWTHVRAVAERLGLQTLTFERQDKFLMNEGLLEELEQATAHVDTATSIKLRTEAREMILPSGMAASFQVLVLRHE